MGETQIPDNRLKLMFTCCHPSLALEARLQSAEAQREREGWSVR